MFLAIMEGYLLHLCFFALDLCCAAKHVLQSLMLHKEKDLIVALSFLFWILLCKHYHLQILELNLLLDFQVVVWVSSDYLIIHIAFLVTYLIISKSVRSLN